MTYEIERLPIEKWKGFEIPFRYETTHYYEADLQQSDGCFSCVFTKKPFSSKRVKTFTSALFPSYWDGSEAYGVISGKTLLAVLEIWREEWSNRLRITELWVDESLRRQGIGTRLMDIAKNRAKELGCRAVMLETQSCNENAISFYLSQGFIFFGFDRCCYSNDDITKNEVRIELGYICL